MIRRMAYIEDGRVHSFALYDDAAVPFERQYAPEFVAACVPCDDERVESGWAWDGTAFAPPAPPAPVRRAITGDELAGAITSATSLADLKSRVAAIIASR